MQISPVINSQPGSGCCPGAHAKVFEIVLIFGLLSILRILRSNESVFNNCYGGSMCMSIFSIILLIINFLCSIAEEVLCYYIITFVKMNGEDYIYFQCLEYYQELKNIFDLNVPRGFDGFRNLEEFYQYSNYNNYYYLLHQYILKLSNIV